MAENKPSSQTEKEIFYEVVEIDDPEERVDRLRELCGDDTSLRERVERLLQFDEGGTAFMDEAELWNSDEPESSRSLSILDGQEWSEPGSMRFGNYILECEIARGAMGIVYRARHTKLKRTVAIKMIRSSVLANEDDVARFLAEAEASASLDHPNIVPIYEIGEIEQQHFFTMKLVEGGTLRDRIDDVHDNPKEAARVIAKVARAIHAAHQRQILHRDIKPGNILMDNLGEPHVTDFGLAKDMKEVSSMTMSGQIMGTPNYMAPEQAAGGSKHLTTAADIYSLGAVFFELLTKRPPHVADSVLETLRLVTDSEPRTASFHRPGVDRDLDTIAMRCLEREPEKRYTSAAALANDLELWLRGEPIEARPVSTYEKALKWMKRKPVHAALAGIGALFLLTLGIGGPAAAIQQSNLRKDAVEALGRSQIALANAAYLAGDAQRALKYLEDCPAEVRDTHWDYLYRFSDESIYRQHAGSPIKSISRDPTDSGAFYSFSDQGILTHHSSADGQPIKVEKTGLINHCMALSSDKSLVAIVERTGADEIFLYQSDPLRKTDTIPLPKEISVREFFFLPGSRKIVIAERTNTYLVNIDTRKIENLEGLSNPATSSSGKRITAIQKNRIVQWNTETSELDVIYDQPQTGIMNLAVSPDGSLVACSRSIGEIGILDVESKSMTKSMNAYDDIAARMQFSSDGAFLLSSGKDDFNIILRIWSVEEHIYQPLRTIFTFEESVNTHLEWDERSSKIFFGLKSIVAYHLPFAPAKPVARGHPPALFLDSKVITSHKVIGKPALYFHDIPSGKRRDILPNVSELIRSRTGETIMSGWLSYSTENVNCKLSIMKSQEPIPVPHFSMNHIDHAAVSPNARYVAAICKAGIEVLRRVPSTADNSKGGWEEVFKEVDWKRDGSADLSSPYRIPKSAEAKTFNLLFPESEKPTLLVSFNERVDEINNRHFLIYDLESGRLVMEKTDPIAAKCMLLENGGRTLYTGAGDGVLRGMNALTLEAAFEKRVHDRAVTALGIHPTGKILATGEVTGLIRLWRLEDGIAADLITEFLQNSSQIGSLDFSPDGKWLAAQSGYSTKIYALDPETGEPPVSAKRE